MSFAGKVAFVTGGASGIGRALCKALVDRGAMVAVTDIDEVGAERAAEELGAAATAAALDVRDAEAFADAVDATLAIHGRIDYLFNNAGIAVLGEVIDTTTDDWYRIFDINLRGVVHGVQAVYPLMVDQGHGHIINTASLAGLIPAPGLVAYGATKHAVVGLSRGLRIEAAQYGVKVSVLCPGFVRTDIGHNATLRGLPPSVVEQDPPFAYDVDACARDVLRGVDRNRGVIVVTGHAKQLARLNRFAPRALDWLGRLSMRYQRKSS